MPANSIIFARMRSLTLLILILFFGCKSDPPLYDKNKVLGRWVVTEAQRNNRITQTVNGAVFSISEGELQHNLYGVDSTYVITWGKESIVTPTSHYTIESAQDSILVLNTTLHDYPFRLSLKKISLIQTEE